MASEESKLLSLYRLDFYKRKKNWKLPEDVRKIPRTSPKITKTNDIVEEFPESEFDVEQVSPHNKAFLEKTDDALEPQLPYDEALEPQLLDGGALEPQLPDDGTLEPQLPEDGALEPQLPDDGALEPQLPDDGALEPQLLDDGALEPQLPDDEAPSLPPLENMASWAEKVRWVDKTDSFWEKCRQYRCGVEDKGVREELAYDLYDGARYQDSLRSPDPASQLELNPVVDLLGHHLEYMTPEQMQQIAGEWLTLHNYPVKQEECADIWYILRVYECGCMCNNLYGLSVRELAQAIRRHHSALTVLLKEQALRETLYPMRDTDPLRPDVVLSSSQHVPSATGYDADTGRGRGRGRLQQHRLVGIQMGRPYWKFNETVE